MDSQEKKEIVKTRGGREANRLIAGQYQKGWDHYEAGGLTAWLMYGPRRELLKCFNILDIYPENYAANCSIKQETSPYIEYAENEGFSQDICGYLRHAMGYALALSRNENTRTAPFGGMPPPSMFLSGSRLCDPRTKAFETIRRYLNVPAYIYDHMVPPTEDYRCMSKEDGEHYIRHNLEGYRGLVQFLEKQTGKKLDMDQLREVVRNSIEVLHLAFECFEMRKNTPCPLPYEDMIVAWRPFRDMAGDKEIVQFYRDLKTELKERVQKGIAAASKEKYRILWLGLPMWFDIDLLDYLEGRGAVVVADSMFHPSRPVEVDLSDPLRALVEKEYWGWDMYGNSDGSQPRCGLSTGSHILDMIRDYKIDGVIEHSVISCRSCSLGNRHISKVIKNQLHVPVISIESHMNNLSGYSPAEVRQRMDDFIAILEDKANE